MQEKVLLILKIFSCLVLIYIFRNLFNLRKYYVKTVYDGDTVLLIRGRVKLKVRLYGIDAPENSQKDSKLARNYLIGRIKGKKVRIKKKGRDKFGRTVAVIFYNGKNINRQLLKKGYAWYYIPKEIKKDKKMYEAYRQAKESRKGIFKNKNIVHPAAYRMFRK